ncbi:hypothetical protein IGI39_004624 [Enterococcus sp. AZ135]|uniref:hypothetical protein n=1 Tax=unclassified Enterococcus TaxID=2608891 RepID=UPI003F2273A4
MKSLFEELNDRMLGSFGRGIVAFLIEHKSIFLILFAVYGGLLLYSKFIYMYYIPTKIKKIIFEKPDLSVNQLYVDWQQVKAASPWFILVPTKNEMWVKLLRNSDGKYQMLFFNKKNSYTSESEMLDKIYEDLKGDFTLGKE